MTELTAVADPCINVCRMDLSGRYCQGCRRTPLEIGAWPRMSAPERTVVLTAIAQRRNGGKGPSAPAAT